MSDAVTNTEIEDVLTSIRRLVSDNTPHDGSASNAQAPLVLRAENAVTAAAHVVEEASLALVLTPEQRVSHESDPVMDQPVSDAMEGDEPAGDAAAPSEAMLVLGAEVQPDAAVDEIEDAAADMAELHEGSDAALTEGRGEERPFDFQQVLEARIKQFQNIDGDDDIDDALAELREADVQEAITEKVVHSVSESGAAVLGEALDRGFEVDEAALREMVADIVRQELQGALGERITRNVRKLVRREIHRALAAHDLA